ncbi:ribonuclease H-like protein [Phanerochaete sordida]|uniref:Ribonuclease H-like protein n=1 Tax=Phanerochaete sordida TaxID=48140 RepID=A0A9P3L7P9_9APHY|nr:ribonuclease H-like protein [Phanerochaete sordida]
MRPVVNSKVSGEPPSKLQRVGTPQKSVAVPTLAYTSEGVPLLKANAAASQIALPVRQAMVKSLWEHFKVLYQDIVDRNPTLPAEHALAQEEEVYKKATKLTYRNAVIMAIAAIKRRPAPDSSSHPSVGTEEEIMRRAEERKKLQALKILPSHLEPHILTPDQMRTWGYVLEPPPGPGGTRPSEEGAVMKCERCGQPFQVKRMQEADECVFHWGKPFSSKTNGEKRRVYTCCSRTTDEEPCTKGHHVFYESDPEDLHKRHPFSHTRSADTDEPDTALDIVALDCEMIYSTGGMRVARVSVVDSTGREIFDEFIKMDEGVEVIDFNTRFSGITPENYAQAVSTLATVRKSLDRFINKKTIIIGHALENDLKTLRMIHHRCVDTVALFPHPSGPPYRRALRFLVKEHLGKTIQAGGGTVGHSSVEDSIATLDLVRWHILNGPKPKPKPPAAL